MLIEYIAAGLVTVFIAFLIFWNINARYYFGWPELKFRKDENIAIGLYPNGLKSVFLFSCDDLSAKTKKEELQNVLETLNKHGVNGTFFTIPLIEGKNAITPEDIKEVTKAGHEIGQHGLTHVWNKNSRIPIFSSLEFRGLSYGEQEKRITEGKKILHETNTDPLGFRTAHFSSNEGTLEILTKEDYLYNSDVRIRPEGKITNKRFLGIVYGSIYFPYFWETQYGKILIIPANGDYTWGLKSTLMERSALRAAKNRFNKFHNKGGVFCLLTHLHKQSLSRKRGKTFLNSFLKHVKEKKVWTPTMLEYAKWWNARHTLKAVTYDRRGTLVVKLEKPSKYPLKKLAVDIKAQREYAVYYNGNIKTGTGPEKIIIDVN